MLTMNNMGLICFQYSGLNELNAEIDLNFIIIPNKNNNNNNNLGNCNNYFM